jgi:hypothetical protein
LRSQAKKGGQSGRLLSSGSLRGVMPMRVMPYMTRHHGISIPPVLILIVTGIGNGIAGPVVLAICIRVVLRAIAGVFDNGLRQSWRYESCGGNSCGANNY